MARRAAELSTVPCSVHETNATGCSGAIRSSVERLARESSITEFPTGTVIHTGAATRRTAARSESKTSESGGSGRSSALALTTVPTL